jgi:hypothetical protein
LSPSLITQKNPLLRKYILNSIPIGLKDEFLTTLTNVQVISKAKNGLDFLNDVDVHRNMLKHFYVNGCPIRKDPKWAVLLSSHLYHYDAPTLPFISLLDQYIFNNIWQGGVVSIISFLCLHYFSPSGLFFNADSHNKLFTVNFIRENKNELKCIIDYRDNRLAPDTPVSFQLKLEYNLVLDEQANKLNLKGFIITMVSSNHQPLQKGGETLPSILEKRLYLEDLEQTYVFLEEALESDENKESALEHLYQLGILADQIRRYRGAKLTRADERYALEAKINQLIADYS